MVLIFIAPPAAMSCMINSLQTAAQYDETLGLINPAEWESFALELAENAPEILAAATQVLKTAAQRNKFGIMVAAAAAAGAFTGAETITEVVHKLVFDDGLFGHPAENSDGENNDDDDKEKPTTTSTAPVCDPSGEVNEKSVCILLLSYDVSPSAWPPC